MGRDQEDQETVEERSDEAMTGDATLVGSTSGDLSMELQTPVDGSQASIAGKSPVKTTITRTGSTSTATSPIKRDPASPIKLALPALKTVEKVLLDVDGQDKESDSIFGDDRGDSSIREEKAVTPEDVDMENGNMESKRETEDKKSEDGDDVDLGYLYTVSSSQNSELC